MRFDEQRACLWRRCDRILDTVFDDGPCYDTGTYLDSLYDEAVDLVISAEGQPAEVVELIEIARNMLAAAVERFRAPAQTTTDIVRRIDLAAQMWRDVRSYVEEAMDLLELSKEEA